MKLKDVSRRLNADFSTVHFTPETIAAVEARLKDRGGKLYVTCQIRAKEVQAKPEEIVRQLWIAALLYQYAFPRQLISVEYPVTFGRDTSKRADIVVFDAERANVPYILIEVKQTTARGGKEQLKSYTHATGAPLAVWSNGVERIFWHRKNPNYFVEIPVLPSADQTIEQVAGQPWTIDTLVDKEKERETLGPHARSLKQLILDMEDEVLANARRVVAPMPCWNGRNGRWRSPSRSRKRLRCAFLPNPWRA